jgi:hypothetical protein
MMYSTRLGRGSDDPNAAEAGCRFRYEVDCQRRARAVANLDALNILPQLTIGRYGPIACLAGEDASTPISALAAGAQHAGDDDCKIYRLRLTVEARRSDAGS